VPFAIVENEGKGRRRGMGGYSRKYKHRL